MLSQPLSLSAFFLPLSFTPSLSHSSWFSLFVPLTHLHAVAHALISSSHSQSMEGSCLINSPRRGFPPIVVPLAGSVAACTCSRVGLPVPHLLLSCCPPGRLSGQIDRHRQTDSQSVSQSVSQTQTEILGDTAWFLVVALRASERRCVHGDGRTSIESVVAVLIAHRTLCSDF